MSKTKFVDTPNKNVSEATAQEIKSALRLKLEKRKAAAEKIFNKHEFRRRN